MVKEVVSYFKKGFYLANKNLDLYTITFLLGWLITFFAYIGSQVHIIWGLSFTFSLLVIVISFFSEGFNLSRPYFFEVRQNHKLSLLSIFQGTWKNTKRLFLQSLLLVIILMVLLVFFSLIVLINIHPSSNQISLWVKSAITPFSLIEIIGIITFAFLGYTSVFFSLEKMGLMRSLKESFVYAWKNISFTLAIIIVDWLVFATSQLTEFGVTPQSPLHIVHSTLVLIVTSYINLITVAAIYIYYRNHSFGRRSK